MMFQPKPLCFFCERPFELIPFQAVSFVKSIFSFGALFFLFSIPLGQAQAPAYEWVKMIGDDAQQSGLIGHRTVEVNPVTGDVYTAGRFSGTLDFDPGPGQFILTAQSDLDAYIVKWDSDGNVVWAKAFNGNMYTGIEALKYDPISNFIYVSGGFYGTTDFDPSTNVWEITTEYIEGFVCKLNTDGLLIWVVAVGTTSILGAADIEVDDSGDLYITGGFFGTADFDPGPDTFNLVSNGGLDIFVAKYDNEGQLQWAVSVGSTNASEDSQEWGLELSTGNDRFGGSAVYVTGEFDGSADFDPGPDTFYLDPYQLGAFVLKLDGNGIFSWACQFSNNYFWNGGYGIDVDDDHNQIYVTGYFSGPTDFDPGAGVYTLEPVMPGLDMFILALTEGGDFVWAKSIGGSGDDIAYAVKVDLTGQGNILVTGSFSGTADFDVGSGVHEETASGSNDVFILKLNSGGEFDWVKTAGGSDFEAGIDLAVDFESNLYVAGGYISPIIFFDSEEYTNPDPTTLDAFLTKIHDCQSIVINIADSGFGSLRAAIGCAGNGDTITFALPAMSEIILTTGEIIIGKTLTLSGTGVFDLTISGNHSSRIFKLLTGSNLTITNMSLKDATSSSNGGAIYTKGFLILENVLLQNNFQNGLPKGLTLISPGELTIQGMVDFKY